MPRFTAFDCSWADARTDDGEIVYAVGDIHGRCDLLEAALRHIVDDANTASADQRKRVVFLGDYIDRGPRSREIVERLSGPPPAGLSWTPLKGNHEDFLLRFLDDPSLLDLWLANGAEATFRSYDPAIVALLESGASEGRVRDAFSEALPRDHRALLASLPLSCGSGDYLFVHAGVRPGIALDDQDPKDLIWIRQPFLLSREDFGKIVVHGHTPVRQPDIRDNRIGIDTGAFAHGRLTVLRLAGRDKSLLTVGEGD